MTPLKQRNLHNPEEGIWGDCHRAAVASMLDLPIDEVPHFGDGGPDGEEFNSRIQAFLLSRGLTRIQIPYSGKLEDVHLTLKHQNPDTHYFLGGHSKTGVDHTVVCLNGEIVHDPSLNESGIVGPCEDGFYWIEFLGSAIAVKK